MKNGIESRTNKGDGKTRYRGVVNSKAAGLTRGPWGTHAEAKSWRVKALAEVQAGTAIRPTDQTLNEAWEGFYAAAVAGSVTSARGTPFSDSALRLYERGWRLRVKPELGAHKLSAVRRADVQAMVDRWAAKGMDPATISNSLDPLRVLYSRAVQRDLVAINPTKGLALPKRAADDAMRFASKGETARLLAALPEEQRALWATAFYGGLRRGELRALRWSDISFGKTPSIRVSRSWDDKTGEKAPKSKSGVRTVPLIPVLIDLLVAHQERTKRAGKDFVFGKTAAEAFDPTTVRNQSLAAWKRANETAHVAHGPGALPEDRRCDPITLHQCRHTCASFMIAAGANAKALSVVMGHASIGITFDRYGHLMPGGEAEVGRLLAEYVAA